MPSDKLDEQLKKVTGDWKNMAKEKTEKENNKILKEVEAKNKKLIKK